MRLSGVFLGTSGLLILLSGATGCRTYQISQHDCVATQSFKPQTYQRAAIITHAGGGATANNNGGSSKSDKNQLFLEAFQVELMRRGTEVVEREKFEKLVNEQLLIQGELANLSDREKALRVGKILNVDVVFYCDALISESRYVYQPIFLLSSEKDAIRLQNQANEQGVVEGVGRFSIYAYHDVGVTVRAIEAKSGEIVWVGYRMLAVCEEVTEKSPTALTSFYAIKRLCSMIIDDFNSPGPKTERKG